MHLLKAGVQAFMTKNAKRTRLEQMEVNALDCSIVYMEK